jgi:predicted small secreted protein
MKRFFVTIIACVTLAQFTTSCVTTQGFVRGDIEGNGEGRNRKNYNIGKMATYHQTATMGSLLFGIIKLNEQDVKSMYNKCIDQAGNDTNTSVIGFYESRGNLKTTRIPGIFTLGLIGLRFYEIEVKGQPYSSKDDSETQ